jgi:F-type H+-transporting ATPase subunit delta
MATLSHNDIAKAIYLVSKDKTGSELHNVYASVTKFLARRRLLSKSKDILERLDKIINQEKGRIVVKVSGAKKLKEESKKELNHFLKERYKAKEVVLAEGLDEGLIGGMKIEVNDEIIDLSVKNKIKKLQEHLIKKI